MITIRVAGPRAQIAMLIAPIETARVAGRNTDPEFGELDVWIEVSEEEQADLEERIGALGLRAIS